MNHTKAITLEELGRRQNVSLEVVMNYDLQPGEPMVRYDKDGSGCPGCPPSAELTGVEVTEYSDGARVITRQERPEWFVVLDRWARLVIDADWGNISYLIFEEIFEAELAAMQEHYDHQRRERRENDDR